MDQAILNIGELALLLRCSPNTVRRLIDSGKIRAERLTPTSPRRVEKNELERYAQQYGIVLDWSRLSH